MKKNVHVVVQGKGGVGKSLVSALLCQYFGDYLGQPIIGVDTDPVNHTLASYKQMPVQLLNIKDGDSLNRRKLDTLVEIVEDAEDGCHIIIDNGASTFVPFCTWLIENRIIPSLADSGIRVLLHTVIVGGQGMWDTLNGFQDLVENDFGAEKAALVVWLNPYFGEVVNSDGNPFEEFSSYKDHADKIAGVIRMPNKSRETFGTDLSLVLADRQTITSAIDDKGGKWKVVPRQRLKIWWTEMAAELDDKLSGLVE